MPRKDTRIFCSAFQNLRLGDINLLQKIASIGPTHHMAYHAIIVLYHLVHFMLLKQRFRKTEQKIGRVFSGLFSRALFKGVSTRFGLRSIETYFEQIQQIVCSDFQNLRLEAWTCYKKMAPIGATHHMVKHCYKKNHSINRKSTHRIVVCYHLL